MSVLIIYFIIWILLGLLVGALTGIVTGGEPPYGLAVDLGAGVFTMIGVGLLDYFLLPLMGFEGPIQFIAMIAEPLIGAALVLWLLRVIKRRREGRS